MLTQHRKVDYYPCSYFQDFLLTRCRNITDVVISCKDMGLDWFEQLLESMFRPKEDKEDATKKAEDASPALVLACQQIVDCLVESVSRSHLLHFLHFPDHNLFSIT